MARVRRRFKKDANHNPIVKALEQMGVSVAQVHDTGIPGLPDIIIGVMGKTVLIEIKNPDTRYGRAGMNDNQTAFRAAWRGGPIFVVSSIDEATAVVNNLRRE